jgi:hypothetical protein
MPQEAQGYINMNTIAAGSCQEVLNKKHLPPGKWREGLGEGAGGESARRG